MEPRRYRDTIVLTGVRGWTYDKTNRRRDFAGVFHRMLGSIEVKKAIPVILFFLLVAAGPMIGLADEEALSDFAVYLRDSNLPDLYRTELRTLCLEEGDQYACFEYGRLYEGDAVKRSLPILADSIAWKDTRRRLAGRLLKADLLYRFQKYPDALDSLDAIIGEFPDKDILVEAALTRAECQYHLDRIDEAMIGLRSIRTYLPEGKMPDLDLYLGLCEEKDGNLVEAEKLIREAENGGSPEAVLHLLRIKLKQGDLRSFDVIAKEIAAGTRRSSCREVCSLARETRAALPDVWETLMLPVVSDTTFQAEAHPEVVNSIMYFAEAGRDMTPFCAALLSRGEAPAIVLELRYALALSGQDTALCDTLAALFREAPDRHFKARCLGACLEHASAGEGTPVVEALLPNLNVMWDRLKPEETMGVSRQLARLGKAELGRDHLAGLLKDLEVGHDDAALLNIALALEEAGDTTRARSLLRALSDSPVPSEHTLEAQRVLYKMEKMGPPAGDVADMVERVAGEGVDPEEIGDLFRERLHDFSRAAGFYRRALAGSPDAPHSDEIRLKLAEALAASALESGDGKKRNDSMNLLADLADTNLVGAGPVLDVLLVSTDWLRDGRQRAFEIIQAVGRRDDLESADLYAMARILYHLFGGRDANVYAQCAITLRRLAKEYPTSREAPRGAFLAARLKFQAGDYVGALESYKASGQVWRKHAVTSLCEEGVGDCYLYSGGVEEALARYLHVRPSAEVDFKAARCYEFLDRPDSALEYALRAGRTYAPALFEPLSLRVALLTYSQEGLDQALGTLDSPLPAIRELLRGPFETVADFALGEAGYVSLAGGLLSGLAGEDGSGCDALLLLSRLDPENKDRPTLRRLDEGETLCRSIFGAMELLYERAYLACSGGSAEDCIEERGRYSRRFPLDRRSRFKLDVQEALLRYQDGEDETATAIIDSLAASGRRDDALAYGSYRQGIHYLVGGDYPMAAGTFGEIVATYPNSDLYYDAVFKLGTAYYMLEKYDSSAVFFGEAALAPKASLVEDAYFNQGLALEEVGAMDDAALAYRNLAVRFPLSTRFERGLMRSAYCFQQAGRHAEAIALYRALLGYAEDPETAAEALYWTGESLAEMGEPLKAACEFMRVVFLFPTGGPWTGTSAFRAGLECEKAGLPEEALVIYRKNVTRFGTENDWGRASKDRLDELEKSKAAVSGTRGSSAVDRDRGGAGAAD
jgi:TolA-binding protein/predicted protein tyrosine phosphatase